MHARGITLFVRREIGPATTLANNDDGDELDKESLTSVSSPYMPGTRIRPSQACRPQQ